MNITPSILKKMIHEEIIKLLENDDNVTRLQPKLGREFEQYFKRLIDEGYVTYEYHPKRWGQIAEQYCLYLGGNKRNCVCAFEHNGRYIVGIKMYGKQLKQSIAYDTKEELFKNIVRILHAMFGVEEG